LPLAVVLAISIVEIDACETERPSASLLFGLNRLTGSVWSFPFFTADNHHSIGSRR
jgi:hypothetical protein